MLAETFVALSLGFDVCFNVMYGVSTIISAIIVYFFALESLFYIAEIFYLVAGLFASKLIDDI